MWGYDVSAFDQICEETAEKFLPICACVYP